VIVPNGIPHQPGRSPKSQLGVADCRNDLDEKDAQCPSHPNHSPMMQYPQLFYAAFPETRGRSLILFLGRIDPKKGLDLLARAFANVHVHYPNAHLVIAGPDNIGFSPTVEQWFVAANCRDRVTFTGMLTGELKQAALEASQVYVAPSYSEGLSLSVLEGMAVGLPCVITTGCNFPEAIVAQAAHVVDIEAEAIAAALIACLDNPPAARAMGDRARQFVLTHYTWDRIATQLIELYTAILSSNGSLSQLVQSKSCS